MKFQPQSPDWNKQTNLDHNRKKVESTMEEGYTVYGVELGAQMCNFYHREHLCEGGGRGCERQRIMAWTLKFYTGLEPGTFR